jgi:hypothetical protein
MDALDEMSFFETLNALAQDMEQVLGILSWWFGVGGVSKEPLKSGKENMTQTLANIIPRAKLLIKHSPWSHNGSSIMDFPRPPENLVVAFTGSVRDKNASQSKRECIIALLSNFGSNRLVIRNDNTKDTCCTLPLYDSSTVNTNCSEEIQV